MQRTLYLDIETIPGQDPAVMDALRADAAIDKAAVKAPSNYKDEAKIAEFIAAKHAEIDAEVDAKWRKTSFDGAYGQLAVIGAAMESGEPVTFWGDAWNQPVYESQILGNFAAWLDSQIARNEALTTIIVGHYVSDFDLRFIRQRCIMVGVRPHAVIARACEAKPWETDKVYDTMVQWAGVKGSIGLDRLCRAMGLPGKGDIDGSKVWDYVRDGRIAEVAAYCADDVKRARAVHRRMTFADIAINAARDTAPMAA